MQSRLTQIKVAILLVFTFFVHAEAFSATTPAGRSTRQEEGERIRRSDPGAWSLSLTGGMGELNSTVAREIPQALKFKPSATGIYELGFGSTDPREMTTHHGNLVYVAPGRTQGSLKWFGSSSVERNCDVEDCDVSKGLWSGLEYSIFNAKYLQSDQRGYFILKPAVTEQVQILAFRVGPMAGMGYGMRPSSATQQMTVSFAGFHVGADAKVNSGWFTGQKPFRIQSGMSVDVYEDLTGHLGQVTTSGKINNDTMTGVAYLELVARVGRDDELALGWKGIYDRLTPFDPVAGMAARNEDTLISIYLRWSGGSNVGSPALGGGI